MSRFKPMKPVILVLPNDGGDLTSAKTNLIMVELGSLCAIAIQPCENNIWDQIRLVPKSETCSCFHGGMLLLSPKLSTDDEVECLRDVAERSRLCLCSLLDCNKEDLEIIINPGQLI